jgi:hypothetical protein
MEIIDFKKQLENSFNKQTISSRVLLSSFRLIHETSKKTGAFQDNRYTPFYYHLGKFVEPKNIMEVGFYIGLLSGSFLKSCNSVQRFLAFQPKMDGYYSSRLGSANIRDSYKGEFEFYQGNLTDEKLFANTQELDMVIVNEEVNYDEHRVHLDILWEHLSLGGLVVMDYVDAWQPAKDAFIDFCKVKNREPHVFKTRYGTGIVQK